MRRGFGGGVLEEEYVSLEGQVVPKKDTFRYLGSMLRRMEILMRTLFIESKQGGPSDDMLLASFVTRGYHKS